MDFLALVMARAFYTGNYQIFDWSFIIARYRESDNHDDTDIHKKNFERKKHNAFIKMNKLICT